MFSQVSRAGAPQKLARTPVVADATGRFTYRVPAGPSRTLRFAYRSGADAAVRVLEAASSRSRSARTLTEATPRAIRSGQRVRFRGTCAAGTCPRAGKLVELQAFERDRWRNIATLRTNARGEFGYRYRFSFRASRHDVPGARAGAARRGLSVGVGTSNRVRVRVR